MGTRRARPGSGSRRIVDDERGRISPDGDPWRSDDSDPGSALARSVPRSEDGSGRLFFALPGFSDSSFCGQSAFELGGLLAAAIAPKGGSAMSLVPWERFRVLRRRGDLFDELFRASFRRPIFEAGWAPEPAVDTGSAARPTVCRAAPPGRFAPS